MSTVETRQDACALAQKWQHYGGCSPLGDFFHAIHPLSPEAARCINEHTFPFSLKKGKFLMSPLEENSNLYFIVKGVIRGFIREEGKEITTWINEEREIVGSFHNIGMKLNTEEYLQALEDTVLIGIPGAMIVYLYTHYPETNIIGRIVLENYYRDAEERAYIGRVPSAHKKYSRFLETKPGLLNRIPLKYIASYLGMTLETLSRVRSRYRKAAK